MLIDRSKEDWGKKVYQLTNKRGVDVVVDNVGAGDDDDEFALRAQRRAHPNRWQHRVRSLNSTIVLCLANISRSSARQWGR